MALAQDGQLSRTSRRSSPAVLARADTCMESAEPKTSISSSATRR